MTPTSAVKLELCEMAALGIRVPSNASAYVDTHQDEVEEYRASGMKISEIADLICDLASLRVETRIAEEAGPQLAGEAVEMARQAMDDNPNMAF